MNRRSRDTIAARATAAGPAAIAVVRISGPDAPAIAEKLAGRALAPRRAEYVALRTSAGEVIDRGLALYFPAPASYTGEDVVELQTHGSPVVVDWLLETVYALGARAAEPGEFSLRAFLNDKLELTQAEAVADLIASGSRVAARAARRSLEGRFADAARAVQAALTELRVLVEAWLDFPDEDIDPAGRVELDRRHAAIDAALADLERAAEQGAALTDGLTIAIAGPPNAGKSSLLNRLAGVDEAIVTDIPGTTRDTLRRELVLDGLPVQMVDTAGLRDACDRVEREGVRRAEAAIARADHVLWVADIREGRDAALRAAAAALDSALSRTVLLNKVDLTTGAARSAEHAGTVAIEISALTGAGIELLVDRLKAVAGLADASPGTFSARRRHLDAIARARRHVRATAAEAGAGLELVAEELRAAQLALGEVTGEVTSDDLLGAIFSSFCIGK